MQALSKRTWPAFRLRTLLVVVAIVALGLGAEAERRRREDMVWVLRREAAIKDIAEGRKRLAAEHRKRHDKLVADAERDRLQIERFEHPPGRNGIIVGGGSRLENHILRLKSELPKLRERIEWEGTMALNADWAADHPREPWPPAPPHPDAVPPPPLPPVTYPVETVKPVVPRIVKKTE